MSKSDSMRALHRSSLLLILLIPLVLLLPSCGPSKQQRLLSGAQKAEKNQQWVLAAIGYGKACSADPSKIEVCTHAQNMRDYAVSVRSYRALELCGTGHLDLCLAEIDPVRKFRTTVFEKIAEVLASAGNLAMSQCAKTSPDIAMEVTEELQVLACLQPRREQLWEDPSFLAGYTKRSRSLATRFLGLMQGSEGLDGTRLTYGEAAACIATIDSTVLAKLMTVGKEFFTKTETQVQWIVDRNSVPLSCEELVRGVGRGLGCQNRPRKIVLQAQASSAHPRWQHTHLDRNHTKRYLAGTREVANPDYERYGNELENAEDRAKDAREDARERELRCRETDESSDCSAQKTAERRLDDLEAERDRAATRYRNEPSTVSEDVYEDYQYTIRSHRWASPYEAAVQIGKGPPSSARIEIVHTDVEQSAFPPAHILADPMEPPPSGYFRRHVVAWLKQWLSEKLAIEMSQRGDLLIAGCASDKTVECWTTAHHWKGQRDFGLAFLRQMSGNPIFECTSDRL